MTEHKPAGPRGIGGWLAALVAQLVLTDLYALHLIAQQAALLMASGTHAAAAALGALYSPSGLLFMAVNFVLLRVFQRRQEARLLLLVFYGLNAATVGAKWIAYSGGYDWATREVVPLYPLPFMLSLGVSLALLGYVQASERVKNTFVLEAPAKATGEPKGLGGAMLLPIGFTALLAAALLTAMIRYGVPARMLYALVHGHVQPFLRLGGGCALLVLLLVILAGIVRKKRYAVALMLMLYGALAAFAAVSLFFPEHFHHNWRGATAVMFGAAGCATYILTSKRVKNTLVH